MTVRELIDALSRLEDQGFGDRTVFWVTWEGDYSDEHPVNELSIVGTYGVELYD